MRLSVWWRRNRTILLISGGALLVIVLVAFTVPAAHPTALLEPANPGPDGAQAVARVLESQGVTTTIARGEKAFSATTITAGTTVMVTSADQLGNATSRELVHHAAAAGHVVLVGPEPATLRAFGLRVRPVALAEPSGDCAIPLLTGLRPASSAGVGYRPDDASVIMCFNPRHGRPVSGAIVESGHVVVVGAFDLFANNNVVNGDNAAIALRLLGQGTRVVWYVPDAEDIPLGDGGSVSALLPGWLGPGLVLVLGAVLALLLWQGRRLGRMVVEPLPVVVKAAESARGRGRLYRRAHDRAHAAALLRRGSSARLTDALHLPRGSDSRSVAQRVAERTGREPDEVRAILMESSVTDDGALTVLATDLARLEKEVGP